MNLLKKGAIGIVFATLVSACNNGDPGPTTILDVAEANGAKVFAAAARKSGADSELRKDGPFTLIAPSDQGMENAYGINLTTLNTFSDDFLKKVVLAQVINNKIRKEEFVDGYLDDLNGNLMYVFPKYNVIGGCAIGAKNNLDASNGIVHIEDCLIGLMLDVPQALSVTASFSKFRELVDRFPDVKATLTNGNLRTIMVPMNSAFEDYLDSEGISSVADIPSETARRILLYHIVPDKRFSSYDWAENGLTVSTALGVDKKLVISRSVTVSGVNQVNGVLIVGADIQAARSFMHVIDAVLIP